MVLRRERVQDLFHGFIAALQFVPLHGERVIEQHDHVVWRTIRRLSRGWLLVGDQRLDFHKAWFVIAAHRRRLRRVRLA